MGKNVIKLSENAVVVAKSRYFMEDEDWEKCILRVSNCVAAIEPTKEKEWSEKFFEMIYNMNFIPAGRVLRNSGRTRGSMLNCYHIPINDSIEEIGQFMKDCLILWSEGGGIGTNLSKLRPQGDPILGKGGHSSGAVSFLIAADAISKTIESGGQRRAAGLASMDVSHPEIEKFIDAKLVDGAISGFNISVMINDEFLQAVEEDDDWELKFNHRTYRTVKAKYLWDKIITNMVKSAEPGLLNTSNLFKNNSWYYDPVAGTNPCGEAVLAPYDACDLGALVLPNFITGNVNTNWQKLEKTIKYAVRFLDNVLDVNKYTLRRIDEKAHMSRRIGLGVMGLADYLFAKELRYGSEKAIQEIEKLVRFIRDTAYEASIELAIEKGSFPKFDPVLYLKSSFVRKLPASIRFGIKNHGIRNVTLLSFAPTGTTSLLPEVSSGVEPLIFKSYRRSDRIGERIYIHPKYKELLLNGNKVPDWFVDMKDLSPKDHFETQAIIQKYCDGAVSKTINMPTGTTPEQLSNDLLEYVKDFKGTTVYVDGSKGGQVYNSLTDDEIREYLKNEEKYNSALLEDDIQCEVCSKDENGDWSCKFNSNEKE